MHFPSLEPNHDILQDADHNLVVMCPFEVLENGEVVLHNQTVTDTATWSKDVNPVEIECPVCEVFKGNLTYVGSPDCGDYVHATD